MGALARFTSWIPVLGDEIEKAHKAISGMIDSEELRKDAIRAERALVLTEKAMESTTEAAVEMEESIAAIGETSKKTAEILEEQAEAVDGLKKSYEGMGITPAAGGAWGVGEGAPAGMTLPQYEAAARSIRSASPGMSATESFRQARLANLAEGGIAMRPMLAHIGEQAPRVPEVVAPLDKLKNMIGGLVSGGVTIHIAQMVVREEADIDRIAEQIVRIARQREGLHI